MQDRSLILQHRGKKCQSRNNVKELNEIPIFGLYCSVKETNLKFSTRISRASDIERPYEPGTESTVVQN